MGAELAEIEALYRQSYLRYRNALAAVTGSYESARDAVQQGFAKAVAERRRFRGEGSLGAWVWKIALREALALRVDFAAAELNGSLDPAIVEPERDLALSAASTSRSRCPARARRERGSAPRSGLGPRCRLGVVRLLGDGRPLIEQ